MKAIDIIKHLREYLPRYTDKFSTNTTATVQSIVSETVTLQTPSATGLQTGSAVVISQGDNVVPIASIVVDADTFIATATTSADHDLTENFVENVNIDGADQADINGSFPLLNSPQGFGVPNRRTFRFQLPQGSSTTVTGANIILIEDHARFFKGRFAVTVINDTTFSYDTPLASTFGFSSTKPLDIALDARVYGDDTLANATRSYTGQANNDDYVAYIVLGDTTTNKDRLVNSDATNIRTVNNDFYIKNINQFSVYVFARASENTSRRAIRDDMDNIRTALYQALIGFRPESSLQTVQYDTVTPLSDGVSDSNTSYYVHEFAFELIEEISTADIFVNDNTRAFRNFENNYLNENSEIEKTDQGDLDAEPIA